VAVISVLLASMLLPTLARSKMKAEAVTVRSNLRQLELAKQMWAADNNKSAADVVTYDDVKPYLGGNGQGISPAIGEKYVFGK